MRAAHPAAAISVVGVPSYRVHGEARIDAYSIESENFESIHNHSAYALIRHDKRVAR